MDCVFVAAALIGSQLIAPLSDGDNFGKSSAISGDWVIVGAIGDDTKGQDAGAAYMFKRNGNDWSLEAKLFADDAAKNDNFGIDVDIDGTTAIVGAFKDDDNGSNSGSVYVFDLGDTWKQVDKITPSDGAAGDNFGHAVGVHSSRIVAGARLAGSNNAGAVYIFDPDETKILPPDPQDGAQFGFSVAVDGDVVIGEKFADNAAGRAWVYDVGTGGISELVAPVSKGDEYGESVSIHDGRIAVGAFKDDEDCGACGAVYVFGDGVEKLTVGGSQQDRFGRAVALSDYLVGTAFSVDFPRAENAGAAYVFDPELQLIDQLSADTPDADAIFGWSADISGTSVIVGSEFEDGTGSAYVFSIPEPSTSVPAMMVLVALAIAWKAFQ